MCRGRRRESDAGGSTSRARLFARTGAAVLRAPPVASIHRCEGRELTLALCERGLGSAANGTSARYGELAAKCCSIPSPAQVSKVVAAMVRAGLLGVTVGLAAVAQTGAQRAAEPAPVIESYIVEAAS